MPLDNEPRDDNEDTSTTNDSTSNPDSTLEGTAATPAVAEPEPTAAPRRRATRARTTKKAAAPVSAEADSGQLSFPASEIGSTDPVVEPAAGYPRAAEVVPVIEAEIAPPIKRVRAPRKRTAPRAAPRAAVETSDLPVEDAPVEAPTSEALTSEAATSEAATSKAPTSEAPTSEAATSEAPASSEVLSSPVAAKVGPLDVPAADPSSLLTADALTSVASTETAPEAPQLSASTPPAGPLAASDPIVDHADDAKESAKKPARRRTRKAAASPAFSTDVTLTPAAAAPEPVAAVADLDAESPLSAPPARSPIMPLFQAPEPAAPRARRAASRPAGPPKAAAIETAEAADLPPVVVEPGVADTGTDPDLGSDDLGLQLGLPEDLADELAADLAADDDEVGDLAVEEIDLEDIEDEDDVDDALEQEGAPARRRRRRGGRGRRGRGRTEVSDGDEDAGEEPVTDDEPGSALEADGSSDGALDSADQAVAEDDDEGDGEESAGESSGSRRRRRRRRRGSSGAETEAGIEDSPNVVTKVRDVRRDDVTAVRGSTRLEAKKQRRREGREAGRRRTILTEAEFLTRRESVDRVMVVRELEGRTQIGVLEDGLLVEHYVARKTQTSTVGNVYLGRVQNVLPSMEAAFVDIGKGRNAVLYAGEVNWDQAGLDGQPRRIEHALKAGEAVLVQVTKDPIGHKGARLTSQISMPGRYLVYVPDGSMTGISRKLPDTERSRLKKILREIVPDDAGVIVRTAAEGASDEELERDVARLRAQWEDISAKIKTVQAPAMLYGEPDLAIKVVRDIFNEDFGKLIVSGDDAWDTLRGYISHVAPDLAPRLERWTSDTDVFAAHRIDEQLAKALDRKVYLPSGGSLVIDRTEAMTVVDVNTGKFTGSGGNLEETVTKNNLEAAEEVVHQLRLRDIGGIIVVDFIDMVLESNRDLVLRRLLECLGRDRTRHQVAEVTSLGLVQMTRKRVGQGLLEVFSETCETCGGRGLILHDEPVERKQPEVQLSSMPPTTGGNGNSRRGRSHAH